MTEEGPGPNPSGPPQLGPRTSWYVRECGTTYPEGAAGVALGLCNRGCGVGAIGICQECQQPVCGYCGRYADGRLVCNQHAVDALREREEQERQAEVARFAHLADVDDPIERLLTGLLDLCELYGRETFTRDRAHRMSIPNEPEFLRLCAATLKPVAGKELAEARRGVGWNTAHVRTTSDYLGWSAAAIARWFARRVERSTDVVVPILEERELDNWGNPKGRLLRGPRVAERRAGWVIPEACTYLGDGPQRPWSVDTIILEDGRCIEGRWHRSPTKYERKRHPERVDNSAPRDIRYAPGKFDVLGLIKLARLAELKPHAAF